MDQKYTGARMGDGLKNELARELTGQRRHLPFSPFEFLKNSRNFKLKTKENSIIYSHFLNLLL